MDTKKITDLLKQVIHPEYSKNIIDLKMVEKISITQNNIEITIDFKRPRDPFANKIKRHIADIIGNEFPEIKNNINVLTKEPTQKTEDLKQKNSLEKNNIKKIIAISSCKGGVGKSTVTANLAVTLAQSGYNVGIIDTDVYGPSIPKIFGVEHYTPKSNNDNKNALITPAERYGVKVQSIGFFIKETDALAWRGPMATNALKQLIHQTDWGELDFLLIDLPPGTGDIHLTVLSEMKVDGAIIVSTPQELSIADVIRGIELFRSPSVNINIIGMVENMAWFTPAELPNNKYYIFGKDACKKLSEDTNIPLLAQIPIIADINDEKAFKGAINVLDNTEIYKVFYKIAEKIIAQLK